MFGRLFENNSIDEDLLSLDCSVNKYMTQGDKELEELYRESVKRITDFDTAIDIVARAIMFGYVNRHSANKSELSAFVKDFRKEHHDELKMLFVKREYTNAWYMGWGHHFDFNQGGLCDSEDWAEYDPTVIFYDVSAGPCSVDMHVVRLRHNGRFEFLHKSWDMWSKKYSCKIRGVKTYKRFLSDIRSIIKDWNASYHAPALDGRRSWISCSDISLDTYASNLDPENYEKYEACLRKYFFRKFDVFCQELLSEMF